MGFLVGAGIGLLMLVGLLMIPLGLPGLWVIVAVAVGLALFERLSWTLALVALGAGLVAEAAELGVVRAFGRAYGGSARAFWGAVFGGMAGLFVGVPVPLVGPIVTAFLGTFVGAFLVTWIETRSMSRSARVGWGVMLARTVAVTLKVGTGAALAAAVAVALIL